MNGKEKMQAAFSKEGTKEIPAVICYEDIFYRDHWSEVTSCPWWYTVEADVERQAAWREEAYAKIGQDWFALPYGYTAEARKDIEVISGQGEAVLYNKKTGTREIIKEPVVGGDATFMWRARKAADSREDIDRMIPLPRGFDAEKVKKWIGSGAQPTDTVKALLKKNNVL